MPIPVITFRASLRPQGPDVFEDFAHPFAVPGRGTASRFVEFGSPHWTPQPGTPCHIQVDVRINGRPWKELFQLDLVSPPPESASKFITHRRDPADDAPPLPDVNQASAEA